MSPKIAISHKNNWCQQSCFSRWDYLLDAVQLPWSRLDPNSPSCSILNRETVGLLILFDITPVSMSFGFALWGDTDNAVYLGPLHIIRSVSRWHCRLPRASRRDNITMPGSLTAGLFCIVGPKATIPTVLSGWPSWRWWWWWSWWWLWWKWW